MDLNNNCKALEYLVENYKYYDEKSIIYKRNYYILTVSSIVLSALIPLISLFIEIYPFFKYLIAFLGSAASIMTALNAHYRFHEKWIEYRSAAEDLKCHKYLFETQSLPYKGKYKDELLLSNVYSIVKAEHISWKSLELNNKNKPPANKQQ
ncbi:hypothetical protein OXPF_08010 [Oxobacter pfennigii]|uniref:SMODS and SLOG-associating 2TM effector domain-containing protein n=1 Tax=Oxobacter pfennigii TaxID=36849 RepID=A0A0N8NTR5_9CLOT|nr:DUF4231 domain-containing protein [Oxobacter pfennigii]KPU45568.1 hypothetical protein OXPF_08010 [Oxobacter pfennigii]